MKISANMGFVIDLSQPALTQIEWLQLQKVTSEALLQAYIEHHNKVNPAINAIVATDIDSAIQQAKAIDARRANGESIGSLQGLPMTIKDTYDVNGLPAVCGHPPFVDRPKQTEDAEVVSRVKAADGIIWGKTNTPLFAGDIQSYNEVYGTTNNPYNHERTSGGSSGGAAAALASHMTPLEIGSDIGGSLRTPAHYCGLYTIKPTQYLIPLKGHVPPPPGSNLPEPDLAVGGPMARTIEDLDHLFNVIAPDATAPEIIPTLNNLKAAVYEEPLFECGSEVKAAIDKFCEQLESKGADIKVDKPIKDGHHLIDIYAKLLVPIIMPEIPPGLKTKFKLMKPLSRLLNKRGVMSLHNMIVNAQQSKAEKNKARAERDILKKQCADFFGEYDILIAPVAAVPAIPHDHKDNLYGRKIDVDGKKAPYACLFQWIALATTCHLPALTIPFGKSKDGLPIGIQIIGKEGSDRTLIELAKKL